MNFLTRHGRTLLLVAAVVVGSFCISYGADSTGTSSSGTFTDKRDGKKYKTVVIGGKTWMAQNLNFQTEKTWAAKKGYGGLYDWKKAKKACPSGWHLPSSQEWNELVIAAGGKEIASTKLKSKSGWTVNERAGLDKNGTDDYGFTALPGGFDNDEGFEGVGNASCWWTATGQGGDENATGAYRLCIGFLGYDGVSENAAEVQFNNFVRCVQN
ncbi:hypothetical protein R80B4_01872 [Fibrobacteres bacterium R8-0-B4]